MQKTQDLLLILTNEERDKAEDYIQRKLKLLDTESLVDLESVGGAARTVLEQLQQDCARLDSGNSDAALGKIYVEIEPEDKEHAWSVMKSAIAEMETPQIRELRDSTEILLGWWQTDRGMHESLYISQWGDINTANGRIAIRKIREGHQQDEIGPFRAFFQTVNLIYQKRNQEAQRVQRKQRLREEAGLGEQ